METIAAGALIAVGIVAAAGVYALTGRSQRHAELSCRRARLRSLRWCRTVTCRARGS